MAEIKCNACPLWKRLFVFFLSLPHPPTFSSCRIPWKMICALIRDQTQKIFRSCMSATEWHHRLVRLMTWYLTAAALRRLCGWNHVPTVRIIFFLLQHLLRLFICYVIHNGNTICAMMLRTTGVFISALSRSLIYFFWKNLSKQNELRLPVTKNCWHRPLLFIDL